MKGFKCQLSRVSLIRLDLKLCAAWKFCGKRAKKSFFSFHVLVVLNGFFSGQLLTLKENIDTLDYHGITLCDTQWLLKNTVLIFKWFRFIFFNFI